jgi:hypothetical protein
VFCSSASTLVLLELLNLIEDEGYGPVGWRRVFSSVGVVPTYRRGLLPISSAWYQRTRLHDVIPRKTVGVLILAATETHV